MAKYLYTLSSHCCVIVEHLGSMPLSLKHWLENNKFYEARDLEIIQKMLDILGYRSKLSFYYVFECLDCRGDICWSSSAETYEKARELLFHIIPIKYTSHLKNPKYDETARSIVARHQNYSAFQV